MKRIDLTQFEEITKGPWEFPLLSGTLVTAYPHPTLVKYEDEEADCRLRLGKINCPYDGRAIAKVPEFIQALKEAYEEIDKLEKALSIINSTHFPKE